MISDYRENKLNVITQVVSEVTGIPVRKLMSDSREYPVQRARQYAMYIMHDMEGFRHEEAAQHFNRTHPASITACRQVRADISLKVEKTAHDLEAIITKMKTCL